MKQIAAKIHSLIIPEDERVLQTERVKYLFQISKKGYLTKGEVLQTFEEWKDIARRLQKGKQLLEEYHQKDIQRKENNPRSMALSHLYEFLVSMCSIYCGFFEDMFREKPDLFVKSVNHITDIIFGTP